MVSACLEIETTRDIARQILRHRSFSFQEFSQRYADPTEDLGFVTREARLQDEKNRQNSVELDSESELHHDWNSKQQEVIDKSIETYNWAIKQGIAKEQARAVLPEGLITSRMYMNGTIRSWIHFIELRSGNGTQKECQDIAVACAKAITEIFPLAEKFIAKS
jgi:thymidylate synthase (FAD)